VDDRQTEATALAPNGWPWATLRGFRAGDAAALSAVYRMHVEDVARLLRHGFTFESAGRTHTFVGYGSAFELQDALHETFRRAFEPRARASYDGIRPFAPYLRTIARNVVLRAFRAQREMFPIADEPESAAAEGLPRMVVLADTDTPSAETVTLRDELARIVRAFLEDLDPRDRELLEVRFVEGLSQRDAAEKLGLGRQQVRGREARLRAALLGHLRAHDGERRAAFVLSPELGASLLQLVVEALR
jgi:RNA polymerase sigma-70 factor (ECF subfamily)